jgi:hypothetical protein
MDDALFSITSKCKVERNTKRLTIKNGFLSSSSQYSKSIYIDQYFSFWWTLDVCRKNLARFAIIRTLRNTCTEMKNLLKKATIMLSGWSSFYIRAEFSLKATMVYRISNRTEKRHDRLPECTTLYSLIRPALDQHPGMFFVRPQRPVLFLS